jgi:hypothetical protein
LITEARTKLLYDDGPLAQPIVRYGGISYPEGLVDSGLKEEPAVPQSSLTLVMIARIPPEGVSTFAAYEDHVIPLLAEHGGVLQRRLRSGDGLVEIHVVCFPSALAFAKFREDPRRARHAPKLEASRARIELLELEDILAHS